MTVPANTVFLIAESLLTTIVAGYGNANVSLPSIQFISDGHPPAADCEELVVTLARTYRGSVSAAVEPIVSQRCFSLRAAEYHIWIIRCTSSPQDSGNPPTPGKIESYAEPIFTDAWLLPYVIQQAVADDSFPVPCDNVRLDELIVQEPRGGFGGVDLTLTFQLGDG